MVEGRPTVCDHGRSKCERQKRQGYMLEMHFVFGLYVALDWGVGRCRDQRKLKRSRGKLPRR